MTSGGENLLDYFKYFCNKSNDKDYGLVKSGADRCLKHLWDQYVYFYVFIYIFVFNIYILPLKGCFL